MLGNAESTKMKESQRTELELAAKDGGGGARRTRGISGPPCLLTAVTGAAVALCLAATLVHVLLVFLYVAPPNAISKMYSQQTNAWVRPVFEQNWRLFAPNPQSVNRHISARVRHTAPDGTTQVSDWVSLSAKDNSAVKHNVFPSHTAQNILRQAWNAYLKTHGSDDRPRTERALMIQKYLRNIAADRVTAQRGGTFDSIQLRVITLPIAAPREAGGPPAATAPVRGQTRYLPWWKVATRGTD
ncbi:DUF5819 family protein [Streptomyces agglomeratus]|uniref:DUF5819 family protein n=1 Tax=Streptomyces agglomeratus TaxID=285458 RepID=UPI000A635DD2|nr:DUF5819 family protein [Streptomyces agglomeratus]